MKELFNEFKDNLAMVATITFIGLIAWACIVSEVCRWYY